MTATMYRVCAIPELIQSGEFKGFIKHINLAALPIHPSTHPVRQARHANNEALPGIFGELLTPESSANIFTELSAGHTVYLQEAFTADQLEILGFEAEPSRIAIANQYQVTVFPGTQLTARTAAISIPDSARTAQHDGGQWHHPNQAA